VQADLPGEYKKSCHSERMEWLVCVIALAPLLHDWRTKGRVDPASWIGLAAIVGLRLVRIPMADTLAWHDFAGWLSGLAG
jgi:hypothetical protein